MAAVPGVDRYDSENRRGCCHLSISFISPFSFSYSLIFSFTIYSSSFDIVLLSFLATILNFSIVSFSVYVIKTGFLLGILSPLFFEKYFICTLLIP